MAALAASDFDVLPVKRGCTAWHALDLDAVMLTRRLKRDMFYETDN